MNPGYYFKIAGETALSRNATERYRNALLGAVAIREDGTLVKAKNGPSIGVLPKAHAEVRLLRKAGYNSTVFVVRISKKTGGFALAKPCPKCMASLRAHRVKKIYYTIDNESYGVIEC